MAAGGLARGLTVCRACSAWAQVLADSWGSAALHPRLCSFTPSALVSTHASPTSPDLHRQPGAIPRYR